MIPTFTLASGHEMPALGLGTGTIAKEKRVAAIRAALDMGYSLLDTADSYHNHAEVAEGILGFPREDIFLSSKVPATHLRYDDVLATCEKNLAELGVDYLDMYLVHSPSEEIPLPETFEAMAELVSRGWVRSIGVSNFTEERLALALEAAAPTGVPISNNQMEMHPLLYDWELLDFCEANDVRVTAYGPLAVGRVFENETLVQVAGECGRSVAQVCLRWLVDRGCVAIPASNSPEHIRSNMDIVDWELSADQLARIDAIEAWERVYEGPTWNLKSARPQGA
jgi:diketogulonate reductase-like aldo/keto reductase